MRNNVPSYKKNLIICERIDEVMTKKNISGSELCRRLYGNDKDRGKISKWRNKEDVPQMEEIPKIAKALRLFRSLFIRWTRYSIGRKSSNI